MTQKQKNITKILLTGGNITNNGIYGIRVRDKNFNPITKATLKTFNFFKDILKKKKGQYIISKRNIIQLHGNSWIKKEYKKLK